MHRQMPWLIAVILVVAGTAPRSAAQDAISYPGVGKGEHFLAAGPLDVVLTRFVTLTNKTTKTEASLILLTKEAIIFQEKDKSGVLRAAVREASTRNDPVLSIQTVNAPEKLTWTFDKKTKLFTGTVLPPPELKITGAPFTKDQESKYMVFIYLQMQVNLDNALKSRNQRDIKTLLDKADKFAQHAEKNGLAREVVDLFKKVRTHHDNLTLIAAQRAFALLKLQENNKQYAGELARIDSAAQARMNVGTAGLLLGFLADDPNLAASSYGGMSQAAQNYLVDRSRLELARKFADGAVSKELDAIEQRQDDAWDKRDQFVRSVEKKLQLPERDSIREFAKEMEKSKDRTSAIRKLNVLANLNRKATPRGNPWLQEEIYYMESLVPFAATQKQKAVENLYELANKTLAEVRNIPPGAVHDLDRTVMLWRAAEMAVRAAALEFGDERSLREAYSPRAVFALRLLDAAKRYNIIDIGADIRELEMVALALAGMNEEALDVGSKISEARANSALLHFYMAKLYAASPGDKKNTYPASREEIVKALKAG